MVKVVCKMVAMVFKRGMSFILMLPACTTGADQAGHILGKESKVGDEGRLENDRTDLLVDDSNLPPVNAQGQGGGVVIVRYLGKSTVPSAFLQRRDRTVHPTQQSTRSPILSRVRRYFISLVMRRPERKLYPSLPNLQKSAGSSILFLFRGVAQLGSALQWGCSGRTFKSSHPDYRGR